MNSSYKHQQSLGGSPSPEDVIANRSGDVLIKQTVLKADHFPSCHNTKLDIILEGAPNFRKIKGLPVYGVAIPTVSGLRNVFSAMRAENGKRKVYWQNLREEPLIFINGQPFVVREADQPFSNLEYTGIDRTRVEDMEMRLKLDILAEAQRFGNQILVVHENTDLSLYDHWEPVTAADVQTPQEVYAELKADGYDVDYLRIPVTDEKAPKDQDFQVLIDRLWSVPLDAALIFNCQMGRGRTTTGMIIASLLHLRKLDAYPIGKKAETREVVPAWFRQLSAKGQSKQAAESDKLKAGMYGVVRSLLRALEKGPEAKSVLDAVIDAASAMQNLREAIASYRSRFLKESRERQRNTMLSVCLEYLERYYMLIAFTGYLQSAQFQPGSETHTSFPDWMAIRTELRSILDRLLRRNSMAALELHVTVNGQSSEGGQENSEKNDKQDAVATRSGAVLGPFTILKEDTFPGILSAKVPQIIDGAPNFRRMSNFPIFGVGMPTVDGIIGVLKIVAGSKSSLATKNVHALWINMREEPMVYINGCPFVLREEVRPLKNMMEYAGIEAARIEAMEERLKKDVLAEALKFGGRILVAHESFEQGHHGELYDTWEEIDHPDVVQTPAEVYSSLAKQGFDIKYVRVPVTDGTSPALSDYDCLVSSILGFGLENPVIFNCQMGIGRTTTGMVIAGMVHMYHDGTINAVSGGKGLIEQNSEGGRAALDDYLASALSPRSDNEQDEYRDEDDEKFEKVWDLEPEQVEEQRTLGAGGYVGVRRVVRLLEEGERSKTVVDQMIDAASDLTNLRIEIMKYRKPRNSYKYIRPELQQRTAAFKKGSAYLERYCMLIGFAFYLEHIGPETSPFSAWIQSRPDLMAAVEAIQQNPAAALSPLPTNRVLAVYQAAEGAVDLEEQSRVLSKRRGRTIGKRTILKSYVHTPTQNHETSISFSESSKKIVRQARDLPIVSVGNISVEELKVLLQDLGSLPGTAGGKPTYVVITDVREELVVYINGTPYTRRELEMPAAALHHAGVHAKQLEELELLMKEDVQDEVGSWGGRILLHQELPPAKKQLGAPGSGAVAGAAAAAASAAAAAAAPDAPVTPERPAAGATLFSQKSLGADGSSPKYKAGGHGDDVTALVDRNPGAAVAPFWEVVDAHSSSALRTPRELAESLLAEGYSLSYCRIPLSRERTPESMDISQLHRDLTQAVALRMSKQVVKVVHLVMSRTATGSSARFVASALASFYVPPSRGAHMPSGLSPSNSIVGSPIGDVMSRNSTSGGSSNKLLDTESGEYRGIMSLCRLLPGGFDAKCTVDSAITSCNQIGNLLSDIHKCRLQTGRANIAAGPSAVPVGPGDAEASGAANAAAATAAVSSLNISAEAAAAKEAADDDATAISKGADTLQFAARQLGLHYLKRYFLLICYRTYLDSPGLQFTRTFDEWVHTQPELEHLLHHLTLQ